MVSVELTEQEADLFVKFQKHFILIELLEKVKAFDIRNGSVEVHFDKVGQVIAVNKKEHFGIA